MKKIFSSFIIAILLIVPTISQDVQTQKQIPEISEKLKAQAVALLRETNKDVAKLKLRENRQYFSIEIANLLWDYDEKESRALFQSLMSDVRQSLSEIAVEFSKPASSETMSPYGVNSAYGFYSGTTPELYAKITKTLATRRYLITVLAAADPQMAEDFLKETGKIISESKLKSSYGESDSRLELQIATIAAEKNTNKAFEIVRRLMTSSAAADLSGVIANIYRRDAEKGNLLAEEFLQKLKSSAPPKDSYMRKYTAISFFKAAADSLEKAKPGDNRKTLLSENSVRELANYIGQLLLDEKTFGYDSSTLDNANAIEKYAPEKAKLIREKYKEARIKISTSGNVNVAISNMDSEANMRTNSNVARSEEAKKYQAEAQKRLEQQKQIRAEKENLAIKLKQKDLSAQDKSFVVEQAKKFSLESKQPDQRIMQLALWAIAANAAGNKDVAENLLSEANSLTVTPMKNYHDYMSSWWLARGYSFTAPGKSFPVLENTIASFNNLVPGFATVAEFIDDQKEILVNDEFAMGFGPGLGSASGAGSEFFRSLQGSPRVAQNLAIADFDRTKALTDKFSRPEFRILARLLVLRSVLRPQDVSETGIAVSYNTPVVSDDY